MSQSPPNILLILTDQQRADTLACYATETRCRTPHLDALAAQSVVFRNAYTVCAVCSPARASLQTGVYPHTHGVETNIYERGCLVHELPDSPALLSRRLQQAGYSIGYTGKWHLGEGGLPVLQQHGGIRANAAPSRSGLPTDLGYEGDDFPGHGDGGYGYPQFKDYLKRRGLSFDLANVDRGRERGYHTETGEVTSPIESTPDYFLVERAIELMEQFRQRGQPFCLQVHFWGPHEPFFAPTKFLDLYRNVALPSWPNFDENRAGKPGFHDVFRRPNEPWAYWENALRHYYACVSSMDAQIGRLLQHLRQAGLYDDTAILFSTDHGDSQGCHGGIENKSYHLYEETVHVPLLIKPATAGATRRDAEQFVQTCDLYATMLDLAGAPVTGHGRTLAPFLRGETPATWRDCVVTEGLSATAALCTHRMIRRGDWKYMFYASGPDELYDLRHDPWEITNRATDPACRSVLTELQQALDRWMQETGDDLRRDYRRLRPTGHASSTQ